MSEQPRITPIIEDGELPLCSISCPESSNQYDKRHMYLDGAQCRVTGAACETLCEPALRAENERLRDHAEHAYGLIATACGDAGECYGEKGVEAACKMGGERIMAMLSLIRSHREFSCEEYDSGRREALEEAAAVVEGTCLTWDSPMKSRIAERIRALAHPPAPEKPCEAAEAAKEGEK